MLKKLPKEEAKCIGVSVTARKHLHPRIIKAVNKEKWMDAGYRLALADKYVRATMFAKSRYSVLTFVLIFTPSEEDLGI